MLKFEGAVNIQGKIYNGEISFFEINPRFSGGIQLTTASGVDFAKILIAEMKGEKIFSDLNNYEDNLIMTSYEKSLFIDKTGNIKKNSVIY